MKAASASISCGDQLCIVFLSHITIFFSQSFALSPVDILRIRDNVKGASAPRLRYARVGPGDHQRCAKHSSLHGAPPATYNVQRIVRQVPVELYSIIYHTNACARTRNFSRGNCMHDVGDAREECMWRCAESDCMNARVRNFRAKFCAKFRENRTFRIRTLYRLREIRTLWHTAQDTLVPGPGHYGARHSLESVWRRTSRNII